MTLTTSMPREPQLGEESNADLDNSVDDADSRRV